MGQHSPEQTGNLVQLHTLYLETAPVQYPEFDGVAPLLSVPNFRCKKGVQNGQEVEWQEVQPFQVSIHALEVARVTSNVAQANALRPLTESEIMNAAEVPLAGRVVDSVSIDQLTVDPLYAYRYSALKVILTFGDGTKFSRKFMVDIGGGDTLTFASSNVEVQVAFPQPARIVQPNVDVTTVAPLGVSGIVLDTLIQASASPQVAYAGQRHATLSTTRICNPLFPQLFKIPAGAKTVVVASSVGFPPSGTILNFVINPLLAVVESVGQVPSDVSSSIPTLVPGTARWIMVQSANAGERITLTFGLEY